jgi:hypothetical protein
MKDNFRGLKLSGLGFIGEKPEWWKQRPQHRNHFANDKGAQVTKYFISFNDGDMTFPEEDFEAVGDAAHAVMAEAINAGVWINGGGFRGYSPVVVFENGEIKEGPLQQSPVHIGGFAIVNVDSDDEAFEWARKIAVACRCAQEVRKILDDPEQDLLLLDVK